MSKNIKKTLAVLSLALVFVASTGFAAGTLAPAPAQPQKQTTKPSPTPQPAPQPMPSAPVKR